MRRKISREREVITDPESMKEFGSYLKPTERPHPGK